MRFVRKVTMQARRSKLAWMKPKKPIFVKPIFEVPQPHEEPQEQEEPTLASLSTTPGLYHALMPWKRPIRLLWLASFIGCTVACIWCVGLVISNYLSYGKEVQLRLVSSDLKFPAVTICSLNPYSASSMINNGVVEFQALMSMYVRLKQKPDEPPNNFIPSEWPPPRYLVQCKFLEIENADIVYSDVTRQPGAIGRAICYAPYILDDPSISVNCSTNGTWQPNQLPMCRKTCSKLTLFHTYVTYSDPRRIEGTTARVVCLGENVVANSDNKSLSRSVDTVCQKDGKWSIIPQCFDPCTKVSATNPYASIIYSDQTKRNGSTLTIVNCTGNEETTKSSCNNGFWDKLPPCVTAAQSGTCPTLFFDNAYFRCTKDAKLTRAANLTLSIAFGADVFATLNAAQLEQIKMAIGIDQPCIAGQIGFANCFDSSHSLAGVNQTTCFRDGAGRLSWSQLDRASHCMGMCKTFAVAGANVNFVLPTGKNESKIGVLIPHGSVATVICGSDFELIGSPKLTCYDGMWDMQPTCLPQCPPLKDPPHGYVRLLPAWADAANKRYPGIVAAYTCFRDQEGKNYVLSNYNTDSICMLNGTWDQPQPACFIQCPHVVPDNGWVKYNDIRRKNETKAVYGCTGTDWWLLGDYVTRCVTSVGKWDYFQGIEPRCVYIPPRIQQLIFALHLQDYKNDSEALNAAFDDARRFLVVAVPRESLQKVGYQKNDFIRLCTYAKEPCLEEDWTESIDPTLGNCFTFNGNISDGIYSARSSGANGGLDISLYTDQQDYMRSTAKAGVAIIIATQNETVLADVDALQAPMGYQTSFSLAFHRLEKLPFPYNNCTMFGEGLLSYFDTMYSLDGCIQSCLQSFLFDSCRCGDPRIPVPENASTCGVDDRDCVNDVMDWANDTYLKTNCVCPPPCTQSYYEVFMAKAKWPSNGYVIQRCSAQKNIDYDTCVSTYRKNNAKISVYYQRSGGIIQEEHPAVLQEVMLSDVGSYVGLWLSLSVVSMFEIVSICWECIQRGRGKRQYRMCD